MARIDYCDTSKSNERTKEILGKNRHANIFRMMAHSPSYFEQYCRLGGAIRHRGELDPVVRELAITRTGILCEAEYGFGLQDADECTAQIEEKISFRVRLLSDADGGALLGDLIAESALIAAFE